MYSKYEGAMSSVTDFWEANAKEFRGVFERNFHPRCEGWSKSGITQL
jgi:hypothetical protein